MAAFSERLRAAKGRKNVTMRDIAGLCGVSAQAVHKWTDGRSMPSSGHLMALCDYLDVSMEWLLASEPLDFHSTETAPQGKHAKYWAREVVAELKEQGLL